MTSQLFGNIYLNPLDHFIKRELKLTLHPKKIYLQPVTNGFPFLGAYLLPYRTYPGRRIVGNFRQAIIQPDRDPQKQENRRTGLQATKGCFPILIVTRWKRSGFVKKIFGPAAP